MTFKLQKEKNGLTREQAGRIYDQLKKDLEKNLTAKKKGAKSGRSGQKGQAVDPHVQHLAKLLKQKQAMTQGAPAYRPGQMGQTAAIVFVLLFAGLKIVLSAMEHSGFSSVQRAEASYAPSAKALPKFAGPRYSKEELRVLTALDERRAKLEERSAAIDERELSLDSRDREFAAKLTALRELTDQLSVAREQNEHKRNNQLEQLANVYGSMNPKEAAVLIEQLDVAIALSLIERMPEKRIGQILSLMSPERALTLTRMLTEK